MTSCVSTSPFNGRVLGEFTVSSQDEIDQKMACCREAAKSWANLSVKERGQRLARFRDILVADMDGLCESIAQISGKVPTEVLLGEVLPVLGLLDYYLQHASTILAQKAIPTSVFQFPAARAMIYRQPFGVVAIISPWNYPFQLSVSPILTALFAGNGVILKPSEWSLPIGKLIIGLFEQLNLPQGLVVSLVGGREVGKQLIAAVPDYVFFTGGLAAGRAVMQQAAVHPIPVLLELGGKDAMVVFADADIARAVEGALYGAFSNSGQVCVSVERLYVQRECYDEFVTKLCERVKQLNVGCGADSDIGAMVTAAQITLMQAHYKDAIAKGAKSSGPIHVDGHYVKPMVIWDVHSQMRVMREECFSPLVAVMPFTDEQEAVQLGNDCDLGLNASVWSKDFDKAERVARQLHVGCWVVNDVLKNVGHPALPFGGVKKSGFGRYHGAEGLLSLSYSVAGMVSHSHLSSEPNWFPYTVERFNAFKGYIDFVYGQGAIWQRARRNQNALKTFRAYSQFNLAQSWCNLKCRFTSKRKG